MRRRRSIAAALFVITLVAASAAVASYRYRGWQKGPWEFHKKKDGISMWLNEEVPTGVHGVRVDTVVDVPADQIFPFLMDEQEQAQYSHIREFKILKKYDDWGYLYQRVKATGIQDRDFTVKLVMIHPETPNGGQYGWIWRQANEKGPPPRDGVVRAEVVSGSYVLTPLGKKRNKTRISYRLWFDPSSWVPDFLINGAVRSAAYETVETLREEAIALKRERANQPSIQAAD
jgi:hypothetical protein